MRSSKVSQKYSSVRPPGPTTKPEGLRFVLLGGFLGAGKTSFLTRLQGWLQERELVVGMVANDQAGGLVDEARFKQEGAGAVASVTGGCFCCKADELVGALRTMATELRPDVILAEPVGSCTDLIATVARPLEQLYGLGFSLAPYTALADARRLLGMMSGVVDFHADVDYIYNKQLEEANVLVVNKVDLLKRAQRALLAEGLAAKYPGKKVVWVSVKTGEGLEDLFDYLLRAERLDSGNTMQVDYERYAEGEAMLGWYNAECAVHAIQNTVDGNKLAVALVAELQAKLDGAGCATAHLKASLENVVAPKGGLAIAQYVGNGEKPALSERLSGPLTVGRLLINLRAQGNARDFRELVQEAVCRIKGVRVLWKEEAAFQPGKPVPVHRLGSTGQQLRH